MRVLYLAISPCNKYICTGAGDEYVKIWKIINNNKKL